MTVCSSITGAGFSVSDACQIDRVATGRSDDAALSDQIDRVAPARSGDAAPSGVALTGDTLLGMCASFTTRAL